MSRKGSLKKIDQVVSQLMSQRGYGQTLVNEQLRETWSEVVGETLARQSRPGQIRQQVLDVFVANSAVNQELTFRRRELLKQLAQALPQYSITDLRFRIS